MSLQITILCSDPAHPVTPHLQHWIARHAVEHTITLVHDKCELPGGDLLFLVSCDQIISAADRGAYRKVLVLHASALPNGRGWSPHIWQIIAGETEIPMTLLEADDRVDAGAIWAQVMVPIPKDALWDEINDRLFRTQFELMDFALQEFPKLTTRAQDPTIPVTYYPRRTPLDSRLDPSLSIECQFDLLRVCDPQRYPAFFDLHGCRYAVTLTKIAARDGR